MTEIMPKVCKKSFSPLLVSSTVAETLLIKRKYKVNASGSITKWWYVVRGENEMLNYWRESGKVFPHTLAGD